MIRRHLRLFLIAALPAVGWFAAASLAQEPAKPEEPPRVIMVAPLAVAPVTTPVVVRVRGIKLAETTEVKFPDAATAPAVKILSKGPAEMPPMQEPGRVGDTQVELELTLSENTPPGPLSFVVVTPAGDTQPHTLLVMPAASLVAETEPNGGFRTPQDLPFDVTLQGSIQQPQDVDVFRFQGSAGQKIIAEVTAARSGSAHDSMLTLYDRAGHVIATADDTPAADDSASPPTTDSLLRAALPAEGLYYLSLVDAHDRGGPTHPYLLSLRNEP